MFWKMLKRLYYGKPEKEEFKFRKDLLDLPHPKFLELFGATPLPKEEPRDNENN